MQAYKKLEERFTQISGLQRALRLLDWDRAVAMPELGNAQRAEEAAAVEAVIHGLTSDPQVAAWAAAAQGEKLDDWQRANLALIARQHLHAAAVPAALVEKRSVQEAKTEMLWREARQEADFAKVRPELEKLVAIVREYAEVKGEKLGLAPYDALMEPYAPGMDSAFITEIFDDYAAFMPPFLDKVLATQKTPLPLEGPFPIAQQEALGREVAEALGFDFRRGRLDVSAHPFSTGIGDDVRITTRYDEKNFMQGLQAVAHEVGHGLYDRYTPRDWLNQPVGISQNMGMAVHESQSLSLDMQLSRSRAYWDWLAPRVQKAFGRSGPAYEGENLHRHAIQVTRGYIRIESDEVTYPAHIIMRARLEKDMVGGKLAVKDLPEAWNAAFKALIGPPPPNDRLGCLQDIHWYGGHFGYFPAYALGAMTAAQLVEKMKKDVPGLDARMAAGDFTPFTGWLKDNVQKHGCLYSPQDLIAQATGTKLSARAFKQHLTERYGDTACPATSAPEAKRHA